MIIIPSITNNNFIESETYTAEHVLFEVNSNGALFACVVHCFVFKSQNMSGKLKGLSEKKTRFLNFD